ncbi:MAG: DUF4233 domain-containing protein [Microbacteriaceae bacterium]
MKNRSTKRTLGSMVLAFQAFVIFFGTLVAFGLKIGEPQTVWSIGLALSFLSIILPGVLSRSWGYSIGWMLQITLLVLSIVIATQSAAGIFYIILAIIFLSLWIWAMLAGSTIDAARIAWEKANGPIGGQNGSAPQIYRLDDTENK